jgi:adenine-specific DNA-methyltransferase
VAQLELPDWPQGLDHPYLKTQLIPYIGNKRSLQGRLAQVFRRIAGGTPSPGQPFLDPFAGSGAVSRLARFLGFRVIAGDWEFYAYVLNFAHLCVGRSEGAGLFAASGGMQGVIEDLNRLPAPAESDLYIAQHYAPANTESADYRVERLFYTRENALRIDAIRARIESLYPGFELQGDRKKEKFLLLAALLYQSATHTNTSGVFKACHKGFGGHSRDALSRILAPIRLQAPELVDGPPA